MKVRRVVTGNIDGKSVFVADEETRPRLWSGQPGSEFHFLWASSTTPSLPGANAPRDEGLFVPPPGGARLEIHVVPAGEAAELEPDELAQAMVDLDEAVPGITAYIEDGGEGMHSTPSVDLILMLRGEVVLELDDGVEATLGVGDVLVQNGTRHRWHNRRDKDAAMAVFVVGAHSK